MKTDLEFGAHCATFEDGMFDITYEGEFGEPEAHQLVKATVRFATGQYSVYVCDVARLRGFSPAARKVLASIENPDKNLESHTFLFVSGAGIKTKAALAIVMAATRLIGKIHYHTTYVASHEEARRLGRAKVQELVAEKKLIMPVH